MLNSACLCKSLFHFFRLISPYPRADGVLELLFAALVWERTVQLYVYASRDRSVYDSDYDILSAFSACLVVIQTSRSTRWQNKILNDREKPFCKYRLLLQMIMYLVAYDVSNRLNAVYWLGNKIKLYYWNSAGHHPPDHTRLPDWPCLRFSNFCPAPYHRPTGQMYKAPSTKR